MALTDLEQKVLGYLHKHKIKRADRVRLDRLAEKLGLDRSGRSDLHRAMDALYNAGYIAEKGRVVSQGALAAKQMKERLHYTTSHTPSTRLCGAPRGEWGTVTVAEVTCPDCKAKLQEQVKLSEEIVAEVIAEEQEICCGCGRPYVEHSQQTATDSGEICPGQLQPGEEPKDNFGYSRWMDPSIDHTPPQPAEPEHGTLPGPGFKSWKPEVIADGSGQWCGNALRFATKEEAEENVRDLSMRWMLVRETRVVESADEVNYLWDVEQGLVPCVPFKKEG